MSTFNVENSLHVYDIFRWKLSKRMKKITPKNDILLVREEKSFLIHKKWLVITLKWLGYFPILINSKLTNFEMKFISWTFIFHGLRAALFLFFYGAFLLINTNPLYDWKIVPMERERNLTDKPLNNDSLIQLSYKFDFRSLVDYSHLLLLLCYILIVSVLLKKFSKDLTMLCANVQKLDFELPGNKLKPNGGLGKIYVCIVFELICHLTYLVLAAILGISARLRLYLIVSAVVHIWISIVQILLEILITISCLGIRTRLIVLVDTQKTMETQNTTLSLLIRIMETFQSTFGGIMALHLSIYTIDILSETFSCMILGLRGDYWNILIAMFYLVGRFVRVYNIVAMCEWLSNEVLVYSDHLQIVGVDIPEHSRELKVSISLVSN